MRFVNTSTQILYTRMSGDLLPGGVSASGGKYRTRLEEEMKAVVKTCGTRLGIRFTDSERALFNQLKALDEKGMKFDMSQLPEEVRNDPTGEKRVAARHMAAQQRQVDAMIAANKAAREREAVINGEVREPVGPGNMKGRKFDPATELKSGFERIMEENARIAAGKKVNVRDALDPIGEHKAEKAEEAKAAEPEASLEPKAAEGGTAMDNMAKEVAEGLAEIGPSRKRGRKGRHE